jgi:hypothetical protein
MSCMTTDNFCFYLQNRLIQTSQTGGQWYSDTSPFSIHWAIFLPLRRDAEKKHFVRLTTTPGRRDRRQPPRRCSMSSRIWGSVPAPALLRAQLKDKHHINDDFFTKTKTKPKNCFQGQALQLIWSVGKLQRTNGFVKRAQWSNTKGPILQNFLRMKFTNFHNKLKCLSLACLPA